VCIYSGNETVKEQSYFYHSSRLSGFKCYEDFLASGSYQHLYLLSADEAKDYYTRKGGHAAHSGSRVLYMRLIVEDESTQLGVLVFEFTPAQIFRSVLSAPGCFVLMKESGRVFGAVPGKGVLEAVTAAPEGSYAVQLGAHTYPMANIGGFDVAVSTNEAVDRGIYDAQALKLAALIVLMALLQSVLLYVLTKHIFGKVNRSISAMDDIVRGGYHGHVPVNGGDELAQIAMRYNTVLDHVDELVSANVEKETAHKSAQLKALQYQMNPHFIYNTLTVFSGQAEKEGNYELSEAISYFGQLLRYNIQGDGLYATLNEELNNARSLFKVYELKYPGRMSLSIDAGQDVLPAKIIKFVIQPLLENSILHGRKGKRGALSVRIQAFAQDSTLSLIVEDDGAGIEPDRLKALREGKESEKEGGRNGSFIGLANIRDRIRLFYGEEASFDLSSELRQYTRVTIRIPIQQEDAKAIGREVQA
jgi:sensor histidine kinase YesM